ncbi:MAG: hypothetical protein IVW51_19180 [Thermaceae bacterium]|nr:hypothetical protein [Thermaceae bacterium]
MRVGFGLIWLVDAILKWRPSFRSGYMSNLMAGAQDQPAWLRWWFDFWIRIQQGHAGLFSYLVAVTEALIALAVILGFARKLTYVSAAALSFMIWATAEGFGGPYTASTVDIGAAVIYSVVFLALLAISAQEGTSRYSVDALIEPRVSWWHWIAEVGGHHRSVVATPMSVGSGEPRVAA